jgi:UDP-N-acetylglucosamine:LPS N-acetylglucosamine transferase
MEYEGIRQQIESLRFNKDRLLLKPFMHDIEDAMAAADLALCRVEPAP